MSEYQAFLATKTRRAMPVGFDVADADISPLLFPFQRDLTRWALRIGKAALFADVGLGKTIMQLEWSRHIRERTNGNILIIAPLAVSSQTEREGRKFGIPVTVCRENGDVRPGINVTNYERIHKFDLSRFVGVVLDESSILKSYMGKTKRMLVDAFAKTPYRLCCSATPAPNDLLEFGNHSEFLSVMPSNEMIARWFSNNTMKMCSYSLKPHAERDFWRWLASWGVFVSSPEDLGHDGSAFVLPELQQEIIELSSENCPPPQGYLFHALDVSATTIHKVKRATSSERARAVADLVNGDPDPDEPWVIWVNTDYEADAVRPLVRDCVEIRGSQPIATKEERLTRFSDGTIKRLLTKAGISGHGMNWQHCNRTVLDGVSFSFEEYYQLIGRFRRFGQKRPVRVYVVSTDAESSVFKTVVAKESAFVEAKQKLAAAVREDQLESIYGGRKLVESNGAVSISVPGWLRSKA